MAQRINVADGDAVELKPVTRLEVIIAVDELHGAIFGTPRVLAVGCDLSTEATRFGAAKGQVSHADGKRERNESITLYWEQDQGDSVTSYIYWQTVEAKP